MKATFKRNELAQALELLKAVLPARGWNPLRRCIRLRTHGGRSDYVLFGTDGDRTFALPGVAEVAEGGDAILPIKELALVVGPVRKGDDSIVTITVRGECDALINHSQNVQCIKTFPVAEYERQWPHAAEPFPEDRSGTVHASLPAEVVRRALARGSFAVAKELTRYNINAVYLGAKAGKLVVISTDGTRAVEATEPLPGPSPEFSAMLYDDTIALIRKLPGDVFTVSVAPEGPGIGSGDRTKYPDGDPAQSGIIRIRTGSAVMTAQTVGGTFPLDGIYSCFSSHPWSLAVSVKALADALKQAGGMVNENDVLRMFLDNKAEIIALVDAEGNSSAPIKGRCVGDVSIKPASRRIRPKQFLEALAHVGTKEVTLHWGGPSYQITVTAENWRYVVMPIQVRVGGGEPTYE